MTDNVTAPTMPSDAAPPEADPLQVAGRVAVATALAATLAAGPAQPEHIQLPQVTPIVQVVDFGGAQLSDQPADQPADAAHHGKKILKVLGMLLSILALAGGLAFGMAKGCVGALGLPAGCTAAHMQDADDATTSPDGIEAAAAAAVRARA